MAKTKTQKSPLYWNGSDWVNQVATEEEPKPEGEETPEGEAGPEEGEKGEETTE